MENNEKNFALEMREIADTYNTEKESEKERDHKVYIENNIKPYIKKHASAGSYQLPFPYPPSYSGKLLAQLLEAEGLTVCVQTECQMLYIEW
jgi:hypothetical protein